jgi:tetratricopeptide (TPR) repeat protein
MKPAVVIVMVMCASLVGAARAAPPESEDRRQTRSRALLEEGAQRYDRGDFASAVDLFKKGYEVWPFPEALFDLCQAYRQEKHYDEATFYCKSYLRNRSDAPNRADVEQLLDTMEAARSGPPRGVVAVGALAPAAKPAAPRARRAHWNGLALGLAGAGAVALGAGAWLVHVDSTGTCGADPPQQCPNLYDTANVGYTLGAGGALAALAGLGWLVHDRYEVTATPMRAGVAFTFAGRF